jgi:hypothetical protein
MKLRKFTISALLLIAMVSSCKKEDDGPTFVAADRTEQQVIDGDSLIGYLETHYYNSGTFETPGNYHIEQIIIKELPIDEVTGDYLPMPDPDNNTLLIDAVLTRTTTYLDVEYVYYVLNINEGGGERPNFSDDVRVNYSGMMQNDELFDSTVNPVTFDLLNLIQAWRLVMPEFRASVGDPVIEPDGTVSFDNYGLGVMFIPSGLAYFASPPLGVTRYANLVFKFELYQTEINDHDVDLVPTYLEDLDDNGNVFDDDTDNDGIPNFLDVDDDADGVLTKFEDIDNDGNPLNDDTDGDGIPNFLDRDSTQSNQD